jgi:cell wall-associated NlpC family hydrolase
MTPLRFDQRVADFALQQLGRPYLWAARGDWAVRPDHVTHQLRNVPVATLGAAGNAFDCAGLVTWASWKAGAADLRGWWSADHLWHQLPERDMPEGDDWNRLVFFGLGDHATHVAIDLGRGLILEAAGGDSTTLNAFDAEKRGARVRIGRCYRGDLLGTRSLAAVARLPLRPGA